jgi:Protein of unknown function (DUF3300)
VQRLFLTTVGFLVLLMTMLMSTRAISQSGVGSYYSDAELDQLLAPIALYPDPLLSQILMASTYPLEVVDARRWSRAHPGLKGEAAVDAVDHEYWDPSVKALVAFPRVLAQLDDDLEWTQAVGDAYLAQEGDVIASIQRLRNHAYEDGTLNDLRYTRVYREREVIYIEPVTTSVVYVPYYDPRVVYHDWWWPGYPPHYWGPPPGYHSGVTFYWGEGISIAPFFFFATFNWHDHHIALVDRHHYVRHYDNYWHRSFKHRFHQPKRWVHHRGGHRGDHVGIKQPRYSGDHLYRSGRYDGYRSREGERGGHRYDRQLTGRDFSRDGWKRGFGKDRSQNWSRHSDRDKGQQRGYAHSDRRNGGLVTGNASRHRGDGSRIQGVANQRDQRVTRPERTRDNTAGRKPEWAGHKQDNPERSRQNERGGSPDRANAAVPQGRAQVWRGNREVNRINQSSGRPGSFEGAKGRQRVAAESSQHPKSDRNREWSGGNRGGSHGWNRQGASDRSQDRAKVAVPQSRAPAWTGNREANRFNQSSEHSRNFDRDRGRQDVRAQKPQKVTPDRKREWSGDRQSTHGWNRQGARDRSQDRVKAAVPQGRAQAWNGNREASRIHQPSRRAGNFDRGGGRNKQDSGHHRGGNGRSFR